MGNSSSNNTNFPSKLNRFGDNTNDFKSHPCIAAFIDDSIIDQEMQIKDKNIIIAYTDAIEIWNETTGDRIFKKIFDQVCITSILYGKLSCLGPYIAVGTNNGYITIYSTTLDSKRKSLELSGRKTFESPILESSSSSQFEMANYSSSQPDGQYASYINIISNETLVVGDNYGRLTFFSLVTANEIKTINFDVSSPSIYESLTPKQVVGAVIIKQNEFMEKDFIAYANQNGLVTIYSYRDVPELFLAIHTQENLHSIDSIVVDDKTCYLITAHLECNLLWVIDVLSGESYIMDFDEELSANNLPSYPLTSAFYCKDTRLYFTGDSKGNIYVREIFQLSNGIGMKLLKRAKPIGDCYPITCLFYDSESNDLVVGDSSGSVRTINRVKSNNKPETTDFQNSKYEEKSNDNNCCNISENKILVNDVLDEYQDGDEVIRL